MPWYFIWSISVSAICCCPAKRMSLFMFIYVLRDKLQWNFNQNRKPFIHENASENIVCEMAANLSRGRWIKKCSFDPILQSVFCCICVGPVIKCREQSGYAPSHWGTSLQCNDVSHWLGAYLDWSLQLCRWWLGGCAYCTQWSTKNHLR